MIPTAKLSLMRFGYSDDKKDFKRFPGITVLAPSDVAWGSNSSTANSIHFAGALAPESLSGVVSADEDRSAVLAIDVTLSDRIVRISDLQLVIGAPAPGFPDLLRRPLPRPL